MKILFLFVVFICLSVSTQAQKVGDILENGIPLKKDEAIFLKYDEKKNVFRYAVAYSRQDITRPIKPISLLDSTIFLSRQSEVPVYILPFNPLNYSTSTNVSFITDQINADAGEALNGITQQLQTIKGIQKTIDSMATVSTNGANKDFNGFKADSQCEYDFKKAITSSEKLNKLITEYKKKNPVLKNFKNLKLISFEDEERTNSEIANIKDSIKAQEQFLKSLEDTIVKINDQIESLGCSSVTNELVYKILSKNLIEDYTKLKNTEKQKLKILESTYELVKTHQEKASMGGGVEGLRWLYPLDFISSSKDKISIYDLTMKKGGYSINNKEEINTTSPKDTLKKTIRVRRFQRFIPEVSVGTAFTFFKYHTYGTVSDSTGQNFVGSPVEKELRNLNITTMVNFNYYIPDSPLHPFYQLGFGVNEGIPTLLTGIGLRSVLGIKKFSISAGIAATWIEELNNLEVGDPVSGTVEIEEDLKYQFSWPPKPYIGLQYNF